MKRLARLLDKLEVDLLGLVLAKRAGEYDDDGYAHNVDDLLDDANAEIRKLMGVSDE